MNAREIVGLLLEADLSAGDRTGVYIFGPGLPPEGFASVGVDEAIKHLRQTGGIPKETPDDVRMVDHLVDKGYSFLIKHHPGNIEIISRRLPVQTTPEGADKAAVFLGLEHHENVAYRKHTTDSPAQLPVDKVLYGAKSLEQPQAQGQPSPKQKKAPRKKVEDFTPLNAPVTLGITFDMGSKQGVIVREVHPGGPAALAGLQAGDTIVQSGEFVSHGGQQIGPFHVYNQKHLAYVLRNADPKYAVPFKIIRGDRAVWLPMQPTVKKEPQPPQTRAEVQPEAQPPAQDFQPNDPTPTRETGWLPPNTSSLT